MNSKVKRASQRHAAAGTCASLAAGCSQGPQPLPAAARPFLTCSCLPPPLPGSQWPAHLPPAPRTPRPAAAGVVGGSARLLAGAALAAAGHGLLLHHHQQHPLHEAAAPNSSPEHQRQQPATAAAASSQRQQPAAGSQQRGSQRARTACRSRGKVRRLEWPSSILLISCFSAPCCKKNEGKAGSGMGQRGELAAAASCAA